MQPELRISATRCNRNYIMLVIHISKDFFDKHFSF